MTLSAVLDVGRAHPHLYRVMFTPAAGDSAIALAAARAQEVYLQIVADMVGSDTAWLYAGLLLTSAHGMAALETTGQILGNKWPRPEELLDLLVDRLPENPLSP